MAYDLFFVFDDDEFCIYVGTWGFGWSGLGSGFFLVFLLFMFGTKTYLYSSCLRGL